MDELYKSRKHCYILVKNNPQTLKTVNIDILLNELSNNNELFH